MMHDLRAARLVCLIAVALAVCGCSAAGTTSTPDGIYWGQSPHGGADEAGSIGRADLTGSDANGRFIVGARAPAGIAVNGHFVYWTNYARGTIGRAKLDGSGVNEQFINGLGEYAVIGIAVDGQHIYWTNSGIDPDSGTIGRASLDGSGVERSFIKAGDSPIGLAVDRRYIYWTHRYSIAEHTVRRYAIGRADLDGSRVDGRFIVASNKLDGVAVSRRFVFWSNNGEHVIGRANLDGTGVSQRCIPVQTRPLETVPEGLAADDRHVYWTNFPADTIGKANLDGSDIDSRFISLGGVPEGIAVAGSEAAASPPVNDARCRVSEPPLLLGPTDQPVSYYAAGWGEAAPAVISNGGAAASGTISRIHWTSWGRRVAVGRGLNPTYTPHGGYYRKPVVIELRATAVRRCTPDGRLVYSRFTAREQVRPGGPMGKWFAWAPRMCPMRPPASPPASPPRLGPEGARGTGLVGTEALPAGQRLSSGRENTVTATSDLRFAVSIQNTGRAAVRHVQVTLRVQQSPSPIALSRTAGVIRPGRQRTIVFSNLGQVQFATRTTIRVSIVPVRGEGNVANNTATYPVIFSLD